MGLSEMRKSSEINGIDAVLHVFRSILPGRCAVYIAAPITSGRHLLHFRRRYELDASSQHYNRLLNEHVVVPNRGRVRPVIAELRHKLAKPVIDPTELEFPGWTQEQYRALWRAVIEAFADEVVFLDGWEYSNGCAYEFLVACQQHLKMYDEALKPLTLTEGRRLIEDAVNKLRKSGHDSSLQDQVLEQLTVLVEGANAL